MDALVAGDPLSGSATCNDSRDDARLVGVPVPNLFWEKGRGIATVTSCLAMMREKGVNLKNSLQI